MNLFLIIAGLIMCGAGIYNHIKEHTPDPGDDESRIIMSQYAHLYGNGVVMMYEYKDGHQESHTHQCQVVDGAAKLILINSSYNAGDK